MPSFSARSLEALEVGTPLYVEALLHLGAERLDEMIGCRAGAQADVHAGLDEFERLYCGRFLHLIRCHLPRPPMSMYFISRYSSTP